MALAITHLVALLTAAVPPAAPWTPATAWVPPGTLTRKRWTHYHKLVHKWSERRICPTAHSRHGGAHRAADQPMGNKLVRPVAERRVSVEADMRKHLDAAARLQFPMDSKLRASALPPDLQCAIRHSYALARNNALERTRHSLINEWNHDCASLRNDSTAIGALMPPTVYMIAAGANTMCMALATDAAGLLDVTLFERFVRGFPIVGEIDDSGVYRSIHARTPEEQTERFANFKANAPLWNWALHRRLAARQFLTGEARARDLAVVEQTWKEVSKGVVKGPYTSVSSLRDAMTDLHPDVPRDDIFMCIMNTFGVPQKGKTRRIDDGRSNHANFCTNLHETIHTPSFFYPAIAARAWAEVAHQDGASPPAMHIALLDLAMAYRTIPTSQPWLTAIGMYNPKAGRVEYFWLPGHNFGLASAVVNFNRYSELVALTSRAFFAVAAEKFYDDFIVPDLTAGGRSARHTIEALVLAFGTGEQRPAWKNVNAPELDHAKTKDAALVNTVLGIVTDLTDVPHGRVTFFPDEERVQSVLQMLREAHRRNRLTPHEASRIRGKLFFLLSAAYGNVGRAATLPLVQRQYRDKEPYEFWQGSELHHMLLFFEALLPALPRLVVPIIRDTTAPLQVYTDASFWRAKRKRGDECADPNSQLRGGLGAVVYDPETHTARYAAADPPWDVLFTSDPFTDWLDRKTYIAELEALAAISVYSTYPMLFAGRKVVHYVDNTVALSALVHGYARKPHFAKLVNVFHLQTMALRTSVYFDYVPSKANIADLPSRDRYTELAAELAGIAIRGAAPDLLAVPNKEAWEAPLKRWVTNPQTLHTNMPL